MQILQSHEMLNLTTFFQCIYSIPDVGEVPKLQHLLKVVQNICLYQQILPDVLSEQPMDFPGLLGTETLLRIFIQN